MRVFLLSSKPVNDGGEDHYYSLLYCNQCDAIKEAQSIYDITGRPMWVYTQGDIVFPRLGGKLTLVYRVM